MNITFKLYASLDSFLPPEAIKNVAEIVVKTGTTVYEVLDAHNVPFEKCHLILINGVFSPPSTARQAVLSEGDALAVWPPVAGG